MKWNETWDLRFLALAAHIAGWSKDPSTKTGAVIVSPSGTIISVGFNGLPQGIADIPERLENRDLKYQMIIHAEMNAILFARRDLTDCLLYTHSFLSCARCATMVIQSGIVRAVAPRLPSNLIDRWAGSVNLTQEMYEEAGVTWKEYAI